jgi:hypothetical protein
LLALFHRVVVGSAVVVAAMVADLVLEARPEAIQEAVVALGEDSEAVAEDLEVAMVDLLVVTMVVLAVRLCLRTPSPTLQLRVRKEARQFTCAT